MANLYYWYYQWNQNAFKKFIVVFDFLGLTENILITYNWTMHICWFSPFFI